MLRNTLAIVVTFIAFIAFWFLMSAFFQFQEDEGSIRHQIAQWFGWFVVPCIATYFVPDAISKWIKAEFKVVLASFVIIIVVLGIIFGVMGLMMGVTQPLEVVALAVQIGSVLVGANAINKEHR